MPLLLIALLVSAMVAGANTIAFELRAGGLEEQWRAEQAAGVPAGDLAPARSQLTAERDRRVGLLPYAPLSNATLVDPFGAPEASASAGVATASGASRRRAEAALARLRLASGPAGDARYESGLVALGRLSSPADLDALARRWDADAARQQATARRLADEAGGLSHGLPADVAGALARLETLEASADDAGISTRAAAVAIAHGQQYLARGYPDLLGAHQA